MEIEKQGIDSKNIKNNYDENVNRILVFGMTENPGGVESVIMNYYRHINKGKIQFDFLCNTKEVAYEDEILKLGGNIYKITARSVNRKKYNQELNDFFEKNAKKYNTIWMNVCSLANIDYLIYAKKYGINKRIIHCHNSKNMDSKIRGILHKINRNLIDKYATHFWACSEEATEWFYPKKVIKDNNIVIIKNAIDLSKFKFNEEIRKKYRKQMDIEENFVIGHVGRLHFQKNQMFLLDVFEKILEKQKNSILLIIGQGEDENKLKEKVKTMQLQDKVHFLGKREDVSELLQAMDLFIFPSVFEGLGISIIEAEVAGLSVLASKDVIPSEVKMNENFSFISLDKKPEEWADIAINNKEYNRIETMNQSIEKMRISGYDIDVEVEKIEKFFCKN